MLVWIRMGDKWLQSGKWWDRMVSMWEKVGIVKTVLDPTWDGKGRI